MKLHQIKLEHSALHDRLLMRISTDDGQEVLLWLTRRCVKLMWPALVKLAQSAPDIALHSAAAKSALLGMRHEDVVGKADFSKPYDAGMRQRPLGEEPILVARIQTKRNETNEGGAGQFVLTLLPEQGQGITVALDEALLHSLFNLLQRVVKLAEWDMELKLPAAAATPVEVPRSLN
jgi:hypothetical protein